jgi:hypothetical protein
MEKYIGDLPHIPDEREYSSAEIDLGDIKFVTYKQAEKNAKAYIERNQHSTSSCVPSSLCNALWLTEQINLAQEPNYRQRSNFPDEGCYWVDQLDLAVNFGMAERTIVPELKTEQEANAYKITDPVKENAKKHKQKSYIFIKNTQDFYKALNTGYAIPFSIFSNSKEYAKSKPEVLGNLTRDDATIRHAICAIPNTAYKNKNKIGFFITDSAHFGKVAKRDISETFYTNRVSFTGAYFIDLITEIEPQKPASYVFTRDLTIGSEGEDVLKLQEILQNLGYFPVNIKPTGRFFGITRQAVKDYQLARGIKPPEGYFGPITRARIHKEME